MAPSDPTASCDHCGKLQVDGEVKLFKCSKCYCEQYCGKDCQVAAWRGGHKRECSRMASEAWTAMVSGMGGEAGLINSLASWVVTVQRGEALSPDELEKAHQLHRLSQIMPKVDGPATRTYFLCVLIVASLASKGICRSPLERVFRECRMALRAYDTGRCFELGEDLNMRSVEILLRMEAGGRREEAVALGRQEAQELEALVDQADARRCGLVAAYMRELARLFNKDHDEAVRLARRALVLAERARFKGMRLRPFLYCLAGTLVARATPLEALPYCRRLLQLTGREEGQEEGRALAVETAMIYGGALILLRRFTEARKVYRTGLEALTSMDTEQVTKFAYEEICLHYYLRDTCKALELSEEALEHGTKARELFKQQYLALDEDKRMPPWRDMLDMSADLLEELGMLKDALACDRAFREHRGIRTISALRREIEALLRGGFDELALTLARSQVKWLPKRHLQSLAHHKSRNRLTQLFTEILEKSGDPADKALVAKLHADLAENEAAIEANRKAVLEQIREEAAAAERLRRQNAAGNVKRSGKKGGKKGRKGRGKARTAGGKKEKGIAETHPNKRTGEGPQEPDASSAAEEEEAEQQEECAVCFLELEEEEDEEAVLSCGHRFHQACVDLWVSNCVQKGLRVTCPMCRSDIRL